MGHSSSPSPPRESPGSRFGLLCGQLLAQSFTSALAQRKTAQMGHSSSPAPTRRVARRRPLRPAPWAASRPGSPARGLAETQRRIRTVVFSIATTRVFGDRPSACSAGSFSPRLPSASAQPRLRVHRHHSSSPSPPRECPASAVTCSAACFSPRLPSAWPSRDAAQNKNGRLLHAPPRDCFGNRLRPAPRAASRPGSPARSPSLDTQGRISHSSSPAPTTRTLRRRPLRPAPRAASRPGSPARCASSDQRRNYAKLFIFSSSAT